MLSRFGRLYDQVFPVVGLARIRLKHVNRWIAALAASCLSQPAAAGLREALAEFDLNDFAIGAGLSTTENVYAGADDSIAAYPAIASLFPAAFDDDLAFSRDGGYGLRWVPRSSWELGALVRFQTLGFESGDSPLLRGLPDRPWTLEVGPTIGWRGWPVDVDYTAYFDLLRHHSGATHMLRFSVPKHWQRTYLIPELALRRYGESFVDYYFGVPAALALPGRPAYAGEAADGWSVGFSWGTQLGANWLVSGRVSLERLGAGIADSPIVDTERRAYMSLQAAYLRPLFKPVTAAPSGPRPGGATAATVTMAAAAAETDAWLTSFVDDPEGASGGHASLAYLDAHVRLAGRHRLEVEWYAASRDSAGAAASAHSVSAQIDEARLSYAFAVLDDSQKEVTIDAGVHQMRLDLDVAGALATPESSRQAKPLPAVGISAEARFTRKLAVNAELRWFMLDLDPRAGRRLFMSAGLTHRTFKRAAFGFGYVLDRLSLDFEQSGVAGSLDFDYRGPSVTLTAYF